MCEEQECPANLLDEFLAHLIKGGGCVLCHCVLCLGSIVGFDMGVWLVMLRGWDGVAKTGQCVGEISRH